MADQYNMQTHIDLPPKNYSSCNVREELASKNDAEINRLMAAEDDIDPAQRQDLEDAKALVQGLKTFSFSSGDNSNTQESADLLLDIATLDMPETQDGFPVPATRRGLLNLLGIELHVFADHIRVDCVLPIPDIKVPLSTSTCCTDGLLLITPGSARFCKKRPRFSQHLENGDHFPLSFQERGIRGGEIR